MYRHREDRRGVVLLIVLGMLLMFALIGITFVLLSGHARRGAESQAKVGQADNPPDRIADDVIKQILRGATDRASVIGPHSLLEDLYGNGYAEGQLNAAPQEVVTGGQLISFTASGYGSQQISVPYQRYVGCVLTMTNGYAKGKSTRIVGFDATQGFQVLRLDGQNQPANGDTFIINGTPFSGTGFGYNPTATSPGPLLTTPEPAPPVGTGLQYALLPNPRAFTPNLGQGYTDSAGPGGANEDYDAADYQNMLLACVVPQGNTAVIPIPSLHRPELVNYFFHQIVNNPAITTWPTDAITPALKLQVVINPNKKPDRSDWTWANATDQQNLKNTIAVIKRRIILRPLPEDHPNFNGSNSAVDVYGILDTTPSKGIPDFLENPSMPSPWDVDNDGDGVMDSIWVDVGLPVRTMRDGRQYKPLAAILCLDLDGRLNLNAHGCLAQVEVPRDPTTFVPLSTDPETTTLSGNISPDPANPGNLTNIPHGQGIGPAEVSLLPLFSDDLQNLLPALNLMRGDAATGTPGRYSNTNTIPPAHLLPFVGNIDATFGINFLSTNKWFDYPQSYNISAADGTRAYGTPLDLHGSLAIGLDLRGQPLYQPTNTFAVDLATDPLPMRAGRLVSNPYDLKLSNTSRGVTRTGAADTPFTVNELEAILRPYDVDSVTLPSRVSNLLLSGGMTADQIRNLRHEVTTESWSIPCPAISLPPERRGAGSTHQPNSVYEMLQGSGVPAANMRDLVGPELLSGLKLDLNRPFGNGRDDNVSGEAGYGVIDEPGEASLETSYPVNGMDDDKDGTIDETGEQAVPLCLVDKNTDYDSDGDVDANDLAFANQHSLARQLYARHMYVIMLTLMHYDSPDPDVAREVAQWAVNVVDFRDRDSIMTGFEYDPNPFDGWNVDGDLRTPDPPITAPYVVWGCERPEMLITETLAFHDRRTEDLAVGNGKVGSAPPNEDDDFDQRVAPEGSLFVEIYNPWTNNEILPSELYQTVKIEEIYHTGIYLRAMAGNSPVWRMIIVDGTTTSDPDEPTLTTPVDIERSIYFVAPGTGFAATDDGHRYYPDPTNPPDISVLKPGRYAVIGPGTGNGTNRTYVGFRTGADANIIPPLDKYVDPTNVTRRIVLTPSTNPEVRQVEVFGGGEDDDLALLNIQPPIAIVINPPEFAPNQPDRLSVSVPFDPADRYPAYDNPVNGVYSPIRDTPLDFEAGISANMDDGTFPQYRWIYLQRLANPLRPYDAATNPYRVIDRAQIDLTAFNGMSNDSSGANKDPLVTNNNPHNFFTRERGEHQEGPTVDDNNLWSVEISSDPPRAGDDPNSNRQAPGLTHHFNAEFAHTLGYLNEGFSIPQNVPSNTEYTGSPPQPFPWLTWLNRPFMSEMELLCVPRVRSSRLLNEFAMTPADPTQYTDDLNISFPHIINFFRDADAVTSSPTNWKRHRLLNFVQVPSPFVGTQLQGEPTRFAVGVHDFHPPFNHISNRRDPGRVNLNTIASQQVFHGLVGDFYSDALWSNFVQSRGNMLVLDNASPTRFANPFRSFAGYYNVPIPALQTAVGREVDATLLRANPVGSANPLFNYESDSEVNNTDRNPYFRYQLLNRLGSTATTQSNVYAVWVTVGYFEVSPAVGDPTKTQDEFTKVYPDGFQIGQELGADTGEITRHRAFYIIDRSIPVGFKRGEDLNVEDAILLRRFVE